MPDQASFRYARADSELLSRSSVGRRERFGARSPQPTSLPTEVPVRSRSPAVRLGYYRAGSGWEREQSAVPGERSNPGPGRRGGSGRDDQGGLHRAC